MTSVRDGFSLSITLGTVCLCLALLPACGGGGGGGSGNTTGDQDDGFDAVSLRLLTTELDFGSNFIGYDNDQTIRILNQSDTTTHEIARCDMPSADYLFPDDTLPVPIPPGEVLELKVRCAPIREGDLDGDVVLWPAGAAASLTIAVRGEGRRLGEEVIIDFGPQTLDVNSLTPVLSVNVPADAISLSIEAVGQTNDEIGLNTLTGPGGMVYENAQSTGPLQWDQKVFVYGPSTRRHGFQVTVPNTDQIGMQLVPGGGTYTFSFRRLSAVGGTSLRVRAIVERRAPEVAKKAVLDLNVFISESQWPTAANAADDKQIQEVLSAADQILRAQDIRLGEVSYYDLSSTAWNDITGDELGALFRQSSSAPVQRMNVFLVRSIKMGWTPVQGIAARVCGPKRNGTSTSGIASVHSTIGNTYTAGRILAHEMGHYLGLWHTVEINGRADPINDTSTSRSVSNLMGQQMNDTLTVGQGLVLRAHPHMRTDPEAWSPPLLVLPPSKEDREAAAALGAGWCGTCGSR